MLLSFLLEFLRLSALDPTGTSFYPTPAYGLCFRRGCVCSCAWRPCCSFPAQNNAEGELAVKRRASVQALRGRLRAARNLAWTGGVIHGLVGQNGGGKTVLMKCVCGLMRFEEGSIRVDGQRIGQDVETPPDLGVMIETPGFLPCMTGYRNPKMLASIRGRIGQEAICQAMRTVGLDPHSRKPVGQYSLGMRQRLGIAQAIMEQPSILILDEPFNSLDKRGASQIRGLFRALRRPDRVMVIVSHNPLDIRTLCDRVWKIDGGVVRERRADT